MSDVAADVDGEVHVGPHRLRFERPDILHLRFRDAVEPEHVDRFFSLAASLSLDRPIYLLRDVRSGGSLGPKTRLRIIQSADPRRVAAIVSYGASFQVRVVSTMLLNAMRVFKRSAPQFAFFDTETEARAWIEAHRQSAS